MQEIDKLRSEIDEIHAEMAQLIQKRLQASRKIWEIKKARNLPLIDLKREEELIRSFAQKAQTPEEQLVLQNVMKCVLRETKTYLESKLK